MVPALLLLLFCSSTTIPVAHAGLDELNYIFVETSSLKPSDVCEGHRVHPGANNHTGVSWMPLSRPHGPCLSSSGEEGAPDSGGASSPSFVADALRWDQHRAGYIQRRLAGGGNFSQEDDDEPPLADSNVVQMSHSGGAVDPGFGGGSGGAMAKEETQLSVVVDPAASGAQKLPGVKQTMLLDTASDVAWVQCAPCPASQCYPQADTLYDPAKSASSSPFPCNSPVCKQLGPYANGCTSDNQCRYRVRYPDGSVTSGTYISDALALTPTTTISGFRFGCSHAARGAFNGKTAGIMALGRAGQSLASQAQSRFGHVFSYCIPPTTSHLGFFILGVPRRSRTRYAVTPMLKTPAMYMVRLEAIIVGGQRLAVPPSVFAAGAVLDSRAPITRLPPAAYTALRDAFRARMTMYRQVGPNLQLDTCYDFTGVTRVALPKISLVFDRAATVELDASGILFDNCFAFASNGDAAAPGILGFMQLQTIEVLYNVGGGSVGFRVGAC